MFGIFQPFVRLEQHRDILAFGLNCDYILTFRDVR